MLQEGEFEPLGSATTRKVDVRVIAATNRDLFKATQAGEFREDLYYRLAVFPVEIPPLRNRLDDISALVRVFAERYAQRLGHDPVTLSSDEITRLSHYSWPGNIRELQNVIERALITSSDGRLNLDRALPETVGMSGAVTDAVKTIAEFEQLERANLVAALEQTNWQISGDGGAARLLDINASTLNSRLKALNIQRAPRR